MAIKTEGYTKDTLQFLFLHGYLSDRRAFINQLKFFEKFGEVFAPDLKGFGDNINMEKPYSLDDYIEEVENYKHKNAVKVPHLIAHSFGGRIALKATAKNNNFCDRLVLTGSAGLKPKNTLKKTLKRATFKVLNKFIAKEKLSAFYSKDYNALNDVMKESFKKIISEHLDYTLHSINNETLIIFGSKDKETPLYMAKKLNYGIKNSQLFIIEGAGHFCFVDKPNAFNFKVSEFLLD